MFYDYFDEYTNFLGPIAIFLIVLLVLISIVMYIFGALGLMALAKKNKLDNPWLAFIPIGNSYLLGKLGFEVYSSKEEKNPTLTWILFGASLASCIVGSFLENIASTVTIVFMVLAYNRIYKNIVPQSATKYTVLSFFFGGIPFYVNKELVKEAAFEEVVVEKEVKEKPEKVNEEDKEIKKERPNFCSNCGNKLTKSAKFCPECGQEIK